jgi:hypothetical protein
VDLRPCRSVLVAGALDGCRSSDLLEHFVPTALHAPREAFSPSHPHSAFCWIQMNETACSAGEAACFEGGNMRLLSTAEEVEGRAAPCSGGGIVVQS